MATGNGNDLARARLAGSNLVGLTHERSSKFKKEAAREASLRIGELLKQADIRVWQDTGLVQKGISAADYWLQQCILVLQQAPLTINIEPFKFFGAAVSGDRVQSIWNRLRSKGPGYTDFREGAEQTMFGYDDGDGTVNGVNVGQDIKKYGSTGGMGANGQPRSHSFVGDMRPKYAGVNFSWASCGAACTYGMSHFVLKDYLRMNAAYAPRDSFGVESRSQIGSFFNLEPILANCATYVLEQIMQSARTRVPPGPPANPPVMPIFFHEKAKGGDGSKGSDYIEAILHTEVVFGRDVEVLRIARQEVRDTKTGDPIKNKTWTVKKATIEKNIKAFSKQHGVKVEYF
ncbi:DUF3626 domain-containing protein [Piscinibacter sakaiensis]|uniref:Putative bacteriophage protein n=1 Tax=Piscinibacter sakaiensis TaxID=1547922 RepID=A0A0K8P4X9_PISS1|nr:DUF3626 domain-containing protein [Piscinibacter sakaiensis]GAP37599.1 putative bacteriophage protein [Piscinibacter sakaiensis]